jgi:hypothetical protein
MLTGGQVLKWAPISAQFAVIRDGSAPKDGSIPTPCGWHFK